MKNKFYRTNSYYEGLLQNLYAGTTGCFLSFMTFFYQYNQSVVLAPEHSECFEKIYVFELENCKIISEMIIKLGGDNKYFSNTRKFLCANSVNYTKNFAKIYLNDIELLEIGLIEVKNIFEKIEFREIKEKLKIILENKKEEIKILKENYFKNNLID